MNILLTGSNGFIEYSNFFILKDDFESLHVEGIEVIIYLFALYL